MADGVLTVSSRLEAVSGRLQQKFKHFVQYSHNPKTGRLDEINQKMLRKQPIVFLLILIVDVICSRSLV